MRRALVLAAIASLLSCVPAAAQAPEGLAVLVSRLEEIVATGDTVAFRGLFAATVNAELVSERSRDLVHGGVTRAAVRERDRVRLQARAPSETWRLLIEVLVEQGRRGQITSWRLDIRRSNDPESGGGGVEGWEIAQFERLTSVEGLYRLTLDTTRQYAVQDLTLNSEDFSLTLARGSVFVTETEGGVTGVVLLGSGTMRFTPGPLAERGQLRVLAGQETLDTPFTAAFVRLNPYDASTQMPPSALVAEPVDPEELARARAIFEEDIDKSFSLDLSDLSRERWSLLPSQGDFLAEVHTKRFDTLTYARSQHENEDVSLFDRERHRNISVYSSAAKAASRGASYDEDDATDYEALEYAIEASFTPERDWIEAQARMRLRIRTPGITTLTVRLAEPLTVYTISSNLHGRLFTLRIKGQNSILVNLPTALPRDATLILSMMYGGRLEPQQVDREAVAADGVPQPVLASEGPDVSAEPRWLYSNHSYWYPQSPAGNFATARLELTVPTNYDCVASGDPLASNPERLPPGRAGGLPRKRFTYITGQPARYLAWLVSPMRTASTADVSVPDAVARHAAGTASDAGTPAPRAGSGVFYDGAQVTVLANPRQVSRGRHMADEVRDMLEYYGGLVGDVPYPSFTLALVDSVLPGGHSPAYMAVLHQPMPATAFSWRNDPVAFDRYPQFYLAHEVAHQFWGQAVGWKNYHAQWISEGFAQYFALLYAEHARGEDVRRDVLRQMRRTAMEASDQGPIDLGYRVGHIRNDSRVFRAVIYNKSAVVLQMLRRLVGDDAFFRGLREFYRTSRFRKVGTDDLQATLEMVTGRPLARFFERWIYSATLPTVTYQYRVLDAPPASTPTNGAQDAAADGGPAILLHFEQAGPVFDIPLLVTLNYATGERQDVVVALGAREDEERVPLRGVLRSVDVNADGGALAKVEKKP